MHHVRGAHDVATERGADALVAEAYAEHGYRAGAERADRVVGDAGIFRAPRARRDEHRVGSERHHVVECRGVVTGDGWFGAELAQVLDEVVDERVVVVDHQHPRGHAPTLALPCERAGCDSGPKTRAGESGVRCYRPRVPQSKAKPKADTKTKSQAKSTARPRTKGSRYTPPSPKKAPPSKLWVPTLMFTCLGLGILVIAANYMNLLPGADATTANLFIGLGLLVLGFVFATRLR